jgi:hypothetical protein
VRGKAPNAARADAGELADGAVAEGDAESDADNDRVADAGTFGGLDGDREPAEAVAPLGDATDTVP